MGIRRLIEEKKVDPCYFCKHELFRQVDQFGYEVGCKKNMPSSVYDSGYGCYQFKRKDDKLLLSIGQKQN